MKSLLVPSEIEGVSAVIPTPDWLPYYDVGTIATAILNLDNKEIEVNGEIVGLSVQVHLNPGDRTVEQQIIYIILSDETKDYIEVSEGDIVSAYEDTNGLSAEYYEEGP